MQGDRKRHGDCYGRSRGSQVIDTQTNSDLNPPESGILHIIKTLTTNALTDTSIFRSEATGGVWGVPLQAVAEALELAQRARAPAGAVTERQRDVEDIEAAEAPAEHSAAAIPWGRRGIESATAQP